MVITPEPRRHLTLVLQLLKREFILYINEKHNPPTILIVQWVYPRQIISKMVYPTAPIEYILRYFFAFFIKTPPFLVLLCKKIRNLFSKNEIDIRENKRKQEKNEENKRTQKTN